MRIRHTVAAVLAVALTTAGCGSSDSGGDDPVETTSDTAPASSTTATATTTEATAAATSATCGDDLLARLTLRQKLAQLLNVGVTGAADVQAVVESEQIGGIFIGSWTDASMLTDRLVPQVAARSALPLMVTIDEEGGRVSRVGDLFGPDPSARVTAQTMTVDETYRMAFERGQELKSLGITVDFAPDVDVSSQPDDSVIGDRSFSDDPEVVTQYAGAYARGLIDAGIMPVLKHFPGHGSASGDSHTGAVTTPPIEQLQQSDLVPYRSLVSPEVGVMLGHLDVPGLTGGLPASISPAAVDLLRSGAYGGPAFGGVIFTDDLSGMRAITDTYGITEAVEAAMVAGVNQALWLTTDEVPAVLDHLEQVVAEGTLSPEWVDESVRTVTRAKGALDC
ncbi:MULTISPECIES: glycoside hydrolase family 3 N-terminal domain-containing protein [Rhodococcus]|uniref:glycoside hydrolase family 3 N-terminal domain-containing protein n=1 Tax=Rhodococcus TaxID=1827 RepID=UPI001E404D56|nr:glycoside hydrolase family 3 N-terminal domain-containing protein [Rhodococcus pyridinivorans]MCD2117563.1 glycoside hydrolase family 3 protein [Rhodococcus pyridinivorans]MCZ4626616.1 glycoside hydrolase family 3 protein [Rhodococcus pyridinivorans]MCZ4647719.1 glycoside hydrolase family 3 protein [Rhodococcus pyridinivorans]MDJ0483709.1 glycoside hydrolase family 3 N-terminal domain-containing protein [Rhodococcus pyridinivorans]MDV7253747.1 glycoside hydrolase family 3 N-terminal domain-